MYSRFLSLQKIPTTQMNKRDCTIYSQWTSRAANFVKTRSGIPTCHVSDTAIHGFDIVDFLDRLRESCRDVRQFSTYYNYFLNVPATEQFRSVDEWFTAGFDQFGNDFLRTFFFILCDKEHSRLVNWIAGYSCKLIEVMQSYVKYSFLARRTHTRPHLPCLTVVRPPRRLRPCPRVPPLARRV